MTLKEFFRKARRGRKWTVGTDGSVRCATGLCPLEAVGGRWLPQLAANDLGMRYSVTVKISSAADMRSSRHRKWLLKNLGVSGRGTRGEP